MASIGPCVAVQDLHHFCPRQQFGSVDKRLPKPIRSWPPSLIVDVGAHDGSDALSYAVHNHSVLSFEPAHSKAQRIRALLAKDRRGRQVTFYEAAVGAHAGNASFYTTGGETDSLADDAVGAPPAWAKNATRAVRKQSVRVVSLDEVVGGGRSVAFLKVDAQGHDAAVLRGAARLLMQRRALVVLFEVSPYLAPGGWRGYLEVVQWMQQLGLECSDCHCPRPTPLGRCPERRLQSLAAPAFAEARLRNLSNLKWGGQASQDWWSDFVCTPPVPPASDGRAPRVCLEGDAASG